MENRKPNTNCAKCNKEIYKRPYEIEKYSNVFCSRKCRGLFERKNNIEVTCPVCNNLFIKKKDSHKYCSKKCSGFITRNRKIAKRPYKNETQRRLLILKENFQFNSCMVLGCNYNKTFDIHRFVHGKNNGKYEIGNMFAICPNHHAEIHRGLIKVNKINDYTLEIQRGD